MSSSPFMFEKPMGMKDTLPPLYERMRDVRRQINEETTRWGYRPIQTPTLEYYETIGEESAILDQQLFKLMDREGRTLVLRPDMTAPIARVASSSMQEEALPLRLSYSTHVYRAQVAEGGRAAEFEQFGVELVGDQTMNADGEMIALMVSLLRASGLEEFRIAIGHIGYMDALFQEVVGDTAIANELRRFLFEKNYVGYRQYVKQLPISSLDKQRLVQILSLRGGQAVLTEAEKTAGSDGCKALKEMKELWGVLEDYNVSQYVQIDLNLVLHIDYYTGVVFEGFGKDLGFPLASGGRYDELLAKFGRSASATGFGIRMDRLVEALNHVQKYEAEQRTLIIFSKERQQEALAVAKQHRKSGGAVVMQNVRGIPDVDAFSSRFNHVIQMIGTRSKEGDTNA